MDLSLKSILKRILSESVSKEDVLDAIRNKYYVRIRYDDGGDNKGVGDPKGSRVIQPFAFGLTKKGHPVVRAFQINGNSRRGAPKWKYFRLDRIKSWDGMRNKHFFMPPDDSYGEYNRTGDRSMSSFIDNAKFNDDMEDPLVTTRLNRQGALNAPKVSTKNVQGPISANQQWKKNVFTSQPNSKKYQDIAKEIEKSSYTADKWADYEKALQQANIQNQAPKPSSTESGPIDDYDMDDIDYNENNYTKNTNKKKQWDNM